ncbi:MAG: YqjK-like family protein [Candidatus Accumulibacter sp.]|uniref:YqjK-like family protein n=1 Tax=Accumulibacter sp. TaxID=2053492 RepID=UPI0019FD7A71|nr:YqjK-like family protein [Accumulibacter sp.]MBE2258991.1 YqjK-like family protein [Paracoccaceae bacterium]MCB1942134.1 YqjK-like family protein [Accumulibacter sp.]MCP5248162.1 YqjK-like family protein [Accumulibacter sp.]
MNQELIDLAVERGRLLERISSQRERLGRDLQPVGEALQTADRAVATIRKGTTYVKQHPEVVTVGVALLVVVQPRRVWRWSKRAFFAWRSWRMLCRELSDSGLLARRQP